MRQAHGRVRAARRGGRREQRELAKCAHEWRALMRRELVQGNVAEYQRLQSRVAALLARRRRSR